MEDDVPDPVLPKPLIPLRKLSDDSFEGTNQDTKSDKERSPKSINREIYISQTPKIGRKQGASMKIRRMEK